MSKRTCLFGIAAAAALLLAAGASQAATIGFDPDTASGAPADTIMLDLVVSDLGGEIVSAYDLDILYDDSLLSPLTVTFSSELGIALSDATLLSPGVLDIAAVSLLSDADLMALQDGNSVTLATLSFQVLAEGESTLDFSFDAFNDVKGANNAVLDVVADPAVINPGIPEPSSAMLFAVGALLVTRSTARRRRAAAR